MNDQVETKNFLLLYISEHNFALPIESVVEIIKMVKITTVPKSPDFVKGILNFRGLVIPVIGLPELFSLEYRNEILNRAIIIVSNNDELSGLIVDDVSDIKIVDVNKIDKPSKHIPFSQFLTGILREDDDLIFILDLKKIITFEELEVLKSSVINLENKDNGHR
ncbi:purine-binding chemotaxis protein CheW [Candidatus Dependentiae bacterium]|nr:purine-binding chemotaxis protein CheW [Candidatus Dependentiae bacterium]